MKNYISKGLVALLACVSMMTSCTESNKDIFDDNNQYVDVEFQVSEQSNMSHYEIEKSPNGVDFSFSTKINATEKVEDKFSAKVKVTDIFKTSDKVAIRIKTVDKNGVIEYYKQIYWVNRP